MYVFSCCAVECGEPPSIGSLHECSCYALTAACMPPALLQPLVAPQCVQVLLGKALSQTSPVQAQWTGPTHQHSCWRRSQSPRSHMTVMSHRTPVNQPQLRTCQGTDQLGLWDPAASGLCSSNGSNQSVALWEPCDSGPVTLLWAERQLSPSCCAAWACFTGL
jgi:hypothetical protein